MHCPFCKETIINQQKFFEDDFFYAFYDSKPMLKGHSLVLPKRHVSKLYDLNKAERADMVTFINKAAFVATKYADTKDYNLASNQGPAADREVEHLHLHIIPRREDDVISKAGKDWFIEFQKENAYRDEFIKTLTATEMAETVTKLKAFVKEHYKELREI